MRIKSSTPALRKTRRFTSTCTTITMTSSPRCQGFLHATTIVTRVRKSMITLKITFARTNASVVDFSPFVLRSLGGRVVIAVDSSRASGVTISTNNLKAAPVPYVRGPFSARDLSTFHVRNLSLSGQYVRSQPHVFGRQLVAIDHQIPVGPARGITKRFHEVVGTSREHLFRQR